MKRYALTLAWILWAHETAQVGDQLIDRGYTAIDSFETRQLCHAAMTDYAGLKGAAVGRRLARSGRAPRAPGLTPRCGAPAEPAG